MGDAEVGAGTGDRAVRAPQLRAPWGRRIREAGWEPPEEWWTPTVNAVCDAFASGSDLVGPCRRLGEARARLGTGIGQSLDGLSVFTALAGWHSPPLALVRALAEGWADAGPGRESCQDPLTGLATAGYLRTRLGELYRSTGGGAPPATGYRLVVVVLGPAADPWQRAARLSVLSHELCRFFTRGESVCLLGRGRIAVVAPESDGLDRELGGLCRGTAWEYGAAVWAVALPPAYEEAWDLVAGLERPG
ncbi:hypothetical protein A6A08_02950 [Nocardiopsis sp. TSRI0078]|uniref:hypothetical protein n=1 Tax=unclassified Nocardiopsis TaxID=2649073 RepID=UPI00093B08F1|nr:hypothetical protein [Nocardiopsis sp. TSRI0078]OKI23737.1 hypothetical protein A6A08_02950 [Nocardiopsis sp. TSRI0078]